MTPLPVAAVSRAPAMPPGAAPPRATFGEVLRRAIAPAPAAPAPSRASPLAALHGVEQARARLDSALSAARAGRTFSAQELLALQSDAYRYQHTVDVASKVAEAGAQSVRQAVNTQV